MDKSANEIIKELVIKHKGDNVGFVLACEAYRGVNGDIYEKIINSSEYKMARQKVAAISG